MTELSKTQAKRLRRKEERDAFIQERIDNNMFYFEHNHKLAVMMYEQKKDELSEQEQKMIEIQIEENQKLIDEWHERMGHDMSEPEAPAEEVVE
jgi:hypothetical protein